MTLREHPPWVLSEAIFSFVLTCAARRARGQTKVHNSMLVHVTRFTTVQTVVRDQVDDQLRLVSRHDPGRYGEAPRSGLNSGPSGNGTSSRRRTVSLPDQAERLTWEQVSEQLLPALEDPGQDRQRHLQGRPRLLREPRNGLSVIAIGGQKLSRGLTLEGLSGQLLPAGLEDVRHPPADGPVVRLPPRLRGSVSPLHHLCA